MTFFDLRITFSEKVMSMVSFSHKFSYFPRFYNFTLQSREFYCGSNAVSCVKIGRQRVIVAQKSGYIIFGYIKRIHKKPKNMISGVLEAK